MSEWKCSAAGEKYMRKGKGALQTCALLKITEVVSEAKVSVKYLMLYLNIAILQWTISKTKSSGNE